MVGICHDCFSQFIDTAEYTTMNLLLGDITEKPFHPLRWIEIQPNDIPSFLFEQRISRQHPG